MTCEHLAWHVAGHAYAAMCWGFQVHKLTLNGFTEADIESRGEARCLDPSVMICLPDCHGLRGGYEHTQVLEGLLSIALAGPAVELTHRRLRCVVSNFWQFTDDWAQAETTSKYLWPDENLRRINLERWAIHSPAVVCSGWSHAFYEDVTRQLLRCGQMTNSEVQSAWERMKAAEDRSRRREERSRSRPREIPRHPESLGDDLLLPASGDRAAGFMPCDR